MAQILWFENYSPADAPVLGGKNASLGTLFGAGLPVPPGFAVSADCYRKALADGGLTGQLDALIAAVDPRDPGSVAAAGERARALIGSLVMSGDLADAIRAAYARLCEQGGDGGTATCRWRSAPRRPARTSRTRASPASTTPTCGYAAATRS